MRSAIARLCASLVASGLLLGDGPGRAAAAQVPVSVQGPSGTSEDAHTSSLLSRAAKGWFEAQWVAYRTSFVSSDGRVIDNANGNVSHSEGQGFGMLLALAADDPDGFALIWRWTVDHLQVRSDGLFAWKWDPKRGEVADRNDATDGDLLIAWALARASKRFGRADYGAAAQRIAAAVAAGAVRPTAIGPVLMPGVVGFGAKDQPDGPVVNLSYWVFPALRDFEALWPKGVWGGLRKSGFKLLEVSRFGPLGLPSDWVALGGAKPAPARNFPPAFGYDAIRIPLYLAWDGDAPSSLLAEFARFSPASDPSVIDVATGSSGPPMGGGGYRAVFALADCAARGEAVPPDLMATRDPLYYPETLRLLSIFAIRERYPRCL